MLGDWGLWGLGWVGAGGIVCSVLGHCFGCYWWGLISGMGAWRWAVSLLKFEIFLRLPYFL